MAPTPTPVVVPPAPTLDDITSDGTTTTVTGTLDATPGTTYTISFYSGAACDPSGAGTSSIGTSNITTDENGHASFALLFSVLVAPGQSASATSTEAGIASAYSACATVTSRACTGDSDCDGYGDAQEIAAGTNPFSYCGIMRADVDGDGIVRIPDLSRVASDYRVDVPPAPARYNQGPPPFDSVINIPDLSKMAAMYNQSVRSCP